MLRKVATQDEESVSLPKPAGPQLRLVTNNTEVGIQVPDPASQSLLKMVRGAFLLVLGTALYFLLTGSVTLGVVLGLTAAKGFVGPQLAPSIDVIASIIGLGLLMSFVSLWYELFPRACSKLF